MNKWLLMVYKIPREPSALRVGVWRKMKQLGAIMFHDAVWILPANSRTQEQFQWLAAEIAEFGGEATVCESQIPAEKDESLVKQFRQQVDLAYKEILVSLRRKNADKTALARRYQQVLAQDYFLSNLGTKVRTALLKEQKGKSK